MSAQWFSPPSKALDPNANPYSGATWNFYVTGTLTPQSVFADAALATSLGPTVSADSAGKFPNIYFDASLIYRAICKSSDGATTLHDIPDVNASAFFGQLAGTKSLLDVVPPSIRAGIMAGTYNGDLTPYIAQIATSGSLVILPPGLIKADIELTGTNISFEGAGKNSTTLAPFSDTALKLTGLAGGYFANLTINTIGTDEYQVEIDANTQNVTFFECGFSSDKAGSQIVNKGDTTTFINPFVYCTKRTSGAAISWWQEYSKDANPSPAPAYQGNNHFIIGGTLYGGAATRGGCGIRITQYNTGGVGDLALHRVEGVFINGFRFISDGPTNVSIGNSLGVYIEHSICDQATGSAIKILEGAEDWAIQNSYIGSVSTPGTGKIGIEIDPAASNGKIHNNSFYNLDYAIKATASASKRTSALSICQNVYRFIYVTEMDLDSIGTAVISDNISGGGSALSGGSLSTRRTNAGSCTYIVSGNALSATPGSAFDATATYAGGGNSGSYGFLDPLVGLNSTTSYANDAAAAVGGVGVGKIYRNGSVVQIRVA